MPRNFLESQVYMRAVNIPCMTMLFRTRHYLSFSNFCVNKIWQCKHIRWHACFSVRLFGSVVLIPTYFLFIAMVQCVLLLSQVGIAVTLPMLTTQIGTSHVTVLTISCLTCIRHLPKFSTLFGRVCMCMFVCVRARACVMKCNMSQEP